MRRFRPKACARLHQHRSSMLRQSHEAISDLASGLKALQCVQQLSFAAVGLLQCSDGTLVSPNGPGTQQSCGLQTPRSIRAASNFHKEAASARELLFPHFCACFLSTCILLLVVRIEGDRLHCGPFLPSFVLWLSVKITLREFTRTVL